MVVELEWHLGFCFEGKLARGCVGEVHPSLYRGMGEVPMGGQPWPELELHGRPWGAHRRGRGGGRGRGGVARGAMGRGC
jgi:hypothetical protein